MVRTLTCRRARIAGGGFVQRALVARDQRHVAAFVGQHFRRGPADALRAAGDQRLLAGQLQIHLMPPFAVPTDTPRTPRRTRGRSRGSRCRRRSPIPGAIAHPAQSRCACSTRTASIVSSGARASTTGPRREVDRLAVQRVHQDLRAADDAREWPDRNTRCRGAYFSSSGPGPGRGDGPCGPAPRAPSDAACRRARRSAPGCRGRSPAPACRARAPRGSAAGWSRRVPGHADRA